MYSVRRMLCRVKQTDLAWAAGLFEGEGSVIVYERQSRLELTSTDMDVLLRFQSVLGGKVTEGKSRAPHLKPLGKWWVSNWTDVRRCAELLLPWMCQRRRARLEELLEQPRRSWLRKT